MGIKSPANTSIIPPTTEKELETEFNFIMQFVHAGYLGIDEVLKVEGYRKRFLIFTHNQSMKHIRPRYANHHFSTDHATFPDHYGER